MKQTNNRWPAGRISLLAGMFLFFILTLAALFLQLRPATAVVSNGSAAPLLGAGNTDPTLVITPAPLPQPPAGVPLTDPAFNTNLRRVSNTSDNGGFETQIYSQLQAFSADNAYLLLAGSADYVVRRLPDLSLVNGLDSSGWNAPRWHPTQAHSIVHYDSNDDTTIRVQYTNVDTLATITVFTFPAPYERIRSNQSFDELSHDGRWLAGMASRNDGAQVIFALDLQNLTLAAQLPLPNLYAGDCEPDPIWGEVEPDWIAVSPLGNYLVVQWVRDGISRCSGLETFDLQSGAFIGRVYEGHQHGDLGIAADGVTEFFMTFELAAPPPNNNFPAIGLRQLPGTATASEPTFLQVIDWFGSHISCQGPAGVCLVTTSYDQSNGWGALEGELFLQYTNGDVQRLVHHRSSSCGYWVQPRATFSRDGRYIVFASDWGQATGTDSCGDGNDLGAGDPYLLDLQTGLPPGGTPSAFAYLPVLLKMAGGLTPTPTPPSAPTATATPPATQTPAATATPPPDGGTFTPRLIDDQISHGQRAQVVDLDGDGDQDVLVPLSLTDAVYLYLNGGDSSGGGNGSNWVTVPIAPDGSIVGMETAVADFDGDGDLDVAAVGLFDRNCTFCSPGKVSWYENPGDPSATWIEHPVTANLWGARSLDVADLTGDGLPDLIVGAIEIDGQGNGLYWFRNSNNGAAWTGPTAVDAALQRVEKVLAHDVDGDGVMDIVAIGGDSNEIAWYENGRTAGIPDDHPVFSKHVIATPFNPYYLALANLDGDAALELLVSSGDGILWYDPPANPTSLWLPHTIDADFGAESTTLYAADFDGDGDTDVAVAARYASLLGWYRRDGGNTWAWQPIQTYNGLNRISGGDLDGDGRPDLVTTTYEQQPGADEVVWWQNE